MSIDGEEVREQMVSEFILYLALIQLGAVSAIDENEDTLRSANALRK